MTQPQISAMEAAGYLLSKTGPISHLKLQKLLYYTQAFHLAVFEQSLFTDEFEAWMHGPVVRSVWDGYRDLSVLNGLVELTEAARPSVEAASIKLSEDQIDLINDVIAEYGNLSAYKLECLTHSERPWIMARGGLPPDAASSRVITQESMREFYRNMIYPAGDAPQV